MIEVRVPATSANLGSGYDALGLALEFYNVFKVRSFRPKGRHSLEIIGAGGFKASDPSKNMLIISYEEACRSWGIDPPVLDLVCLNAIPFCRGLGSSSSAIVGGVLIANELRRKPLTKKELLPIMVSLEGHPDNVVPCCVGGFVVSCWDKSELKYSSVSCGYKDIKAVVAVPDVLVSTEKARAVLPEKVSMEDSVFNLSRAALLASSWGNGDWANLSWAMEDRLHQPFRAKLFPGGEKILIDLKTFSGCKGVAISGSGPTMLAFADSKPHELGQRMCSLFSKCGVHSRFFVLNICEGGAIVKNNLDEKRDRRILNGL